jgi:hypothetical protein
MTNEQDTPGRPKKEECEAALGLKFPQRTTINELVEYVRVQFGIVPSEEGGPVDVAVEFLSYLTDQELVGIGLTDSERDKPIMQELVRRLRAASPECRSAYLDLLAQVASRFAGFGKFRFTHACINPIMPYLTPSEVWEFTGKLDRLSCHTNYLEKPDRDVKLEMVTGRPLAAHESILQLSEADLQSLDGKSLLLIGGGPTTPVSEELRARGIQSRITNIDPAAEDQADATSIRGSFTSSEISSSGNREAWAVHSLPTYALPEEVPVFYRKALASLEKGGVLRVCPITNFREGLTPLLAITRPFACNLSLAFLERLKARQDLFDVSMYEVEHDLSYLKGKNPHKILHQKRPDSVTLQGASIRVLGEPEETRAFLEGLEFGEEDAIRPPKVG